MVYALKINSAIFFSSADFSTFDDRIILSMDGCLHCINKFTRRCGFLPMSDTPQGF
jgi:hypothetical protein